MPRRYFDFSGWISFHQFEGLNRVISAIAALSFLVQLLFLANFFRSIFKGEKLTTKNPWQANTLEWTTPIHPAHGNWPGEIPEVYRGPYEYGKEIVDGIDYAPQDLAPGDRVLSPSTIIVPQLPGPG